MRILEGHNGPVMCLAYSPDGLTLASGSWDRTVRLWDLVSGKQTGALPDISREPIALGFSPDERMLMVASTTETACYIRDRQNGWQRTSSMSRGALSLVFSLDGRYLILAPHGPASPIWYDLASDGKLVPTGAAQHSLDALTLAAGGRCLAGVGGPHGLCTLTPPVPGNRWKVHAPDSGPLMSVAASPDAGKIVTGARDGVVLLWVRNEERYIASPLGRHADWVLGVAFHPDGKEAISTSLDGEVKRWDVVGRMEKEALDWRISSIRAIAFSPDGSTAAAGGFDNTVMVWDVE